MVQCCATLLDKTRCTYTATFPKESPSTCRMPSHVEQKFQDSVKEAGLLGKAAQYIKASVCHVSTAMHCKCHLIAVILRLKIDPILCRI